MKSWSIPTAIIVWGRMGVAAQPVGVRPADCRGRVISRAVEGEGSRHGNITRKNAHPDPLLDGQRIADLGYCFDQVQRTKKYLGCKRRFREAVNDRDGIDPG
jgi:hypothetical protein